MAGWPSDVDRAAGEPSEHTSPPGVPRWVTVFAVITLVLFLLVVVILLTGDGHGPSRHVPPADTEYSAQPAMAAFSGLLR